MNRVLIEICRRCRAAFSAGPYYNPYIDVCPKCQAKEKRKRVGVCESCGAEYVGDPGWKYCWPCFEDDIKLQEAHTREDQG